MDTILEWLVVIIIILICFYKFLCWLHAPVHTKLLFQKHILLKEEIRKYGLIHFTNSENVSKVINQGLIGNVSDMSKYEKKLGKLIWFYSYHPGDADYIEKIHNKLKSKKRGKNRYDACILVYGFTESEIRAMKFAAFFGGNYGAIAYYGNKLTGKNIKEIKRW